MNLDESAVDPQMLRAMTECLEPRGPDDEGVWVEGSIGLAHRRLSIIDLTDAARQPFASADGRVQLTYNGEIYNFQDLRRELSDMGFAFRSQSDTEVLINGYLAWGIPELLRRLEGMFAFVIHDMTNRTAYACRDRFGQKPLYYFHSPDCFAFSSDIRSLQRVFATGLTMDFESLDYYLSELAVPQPRTIWREVRQVRPGHFLKLESGKLDEIEYWRLEPHRFQGTLEEAELEFEARLVAAVKKRTVADVPIACMLSGGIDSGLVAAILAQHTDKRLRTFTVGSSDKQMDERELAARVARRYGTDHKELVVDSNSERVLEELVEIYGEPFADSSCIPTFLISQLVSKHVKVVLSGDGGDELAGGYTDYDTAFWAERLRRKGISRYPMLPRFCNRLAYGLGHAPVNYGHVEAWLQQTNGLKLYRDMGFHPLQKQQLYATEFKEARPSFAMDHLNNTWATCNGDSVTNALFVASYRTRLPNSYLVKVDRASMANSLEVRSPFLDHELVSFALGLPDEFRLKGGQRKYLLKRLATKYFGENVSRRKKRGFVVPVANWLRNQWKPLMTDVLLGRSFLERGIFNQDYVCRLVSEHTSGLRDHGYRLLALMILAIWLRRLPTIK